MSTSAQISVEFLPSLGNIDRQSWNAITGTDYPFLRHEFLYGLEQSGCTTTETGWQPYHAILKRDEELVGLMPMYLKSHSYGEYVFDWSWADAWQRSGLQYYPKLVTAIPFTPATGPRVCCLPDIETEEACALLLAGIRQFAQERGISSWHLLFPDAALSQFVTQLGAHQRSAAQFHWFNEDYRDFDDFLGTFSSRKRKSLRRERRRVAEQGLQMETLVGGDIGPAEWTLFHRLYQMTYAKRSGHGGYLTREFFTQVAPSLEQQVIMVIARKAQEAVAAALYFRSADTLYGRYWGCSEEYDCLHFETCYYQGIEYCIAEGLKRFDPGAQGEHKIQRGFRPIRTVSNHWIENKELASAVAEFTVRESAHIDQYIDEAAELLPFKRA